LANRQAGANGCQRSSIVGFAVVGFGKGCKRFEFCVREVTVYIQQGVVQVLADLLHKALALAVEQTLGLPTAQQPRNHRAQAVGSHAGNGKAHLGPCLTGG